MQVGTYTGATSYTGIIEQNIAQLLCELTWGAANTEVYNAVLTLFRSGNASETLIPGLTFAQLADVAAYMGGVVEEITANKTVKFGLPMSGQNACDMSKNTLGFQITGATAAATYAISAIDDKDIDNDIVYISPIGLLANAEKQIKCSSSVYAFFDPTTLTRIKVQYNNGKIVEYSVAELKQLARNNNEIAKVITGAVTVGYSSLMGVVVNDVDQMFITASSAATGYLVDLKKL